MGAVSLTRNSSAELQEILCIGDPEVASSLGIARVLSGAPASTNAGLAVRIVSGPSSVADFSVRAVLPSTATDNPVSAAQASTVWAVQVDGRVRAQNSTIGDLLASVQQNSTVWAVQVDGRVRAQNSTIGDLLASVQQNSTVWAVQLPSSQSFQVKNSTIGDLLASVQQNSTVWQTQAAVRTSSGGGVEGSTTTPAAGALGLHVRPCFPTLLSTTVNVTSTNSTSFYTLIDAAGAGLKNKVYAYFIGSTHTIPSTGEFISSTSAPKWAVNFGSGSSGITGANLAVSPPAYLFETAANTSLTFRVAGNSTAAATTVLRVSISWFAEA